MLAVLISLASLIVLILIALKLALGKEEDDIDDNSGNLIHVSGIYSVVRDSPREALAAQRPSEDDMRRYLASVSADITGAPLDDRDRDALIRHWKERTDVNLRTIEDGDKRGAAFYFYDYPDGMCPVCEHVVPRGNFVTREEIHKFPQVIPPFHLGCTCALLAHSGSEYHRGETTIAGMKPFFENAALPSLPEWTAVVSPLSSAER